MKIDAVDLFNYTIILTNSPGHQGVLIRLTNDQGLISWGESSPLPYWSADTYATTLTQLQHHASSIKSIQWELSTCLTQLNKLGLSPAASFGLESALLSLLDPLPLHTVATSALFMGSPDEIIKQASARLHEGHTSAKLKIGHLSFDDATDIIHILKDKFSLRIDVNKAWTTDKSLEFFSQFPLHTFDYIEEPCQNTRDLSLFSHPVAIDESFFTLSLSELEAISSLKAIVYKPTLRGGLVNAFKIYSWAKKRNIAFILSSSFESDLGLSHIGSLAHRLSLSAPVGIGTYHYLQDYLCSHDLQPATPLMNIHPNPHPFIDKIHLV